MGGAGEGRQRYLNLCTLVGGRLPHIYIYIIYVYIYIHAYLTPFLHEYSKQVLSGTE